MTGARSAWIGVALLASTPAMAEAQREPYPVDSARIDLQVWRDSTRVRQEYWLARAVRALDLTWFMNACASVGTPAATSGGLPVVFAADTNTPWVVLHDTTDAALLGEGPVRYVLSYVVTHGGGGQASIPVLQPNGPLGTRGGAVTPKVRLRVITEDGDRRPVLPRFSLVREGVWEASMVAIPANVVARGPIAGDATCDDEAPVAGENGDFPRLVALFVLTIVLWIPLYFWWATRKRDAPEEGAP
jgi:hypothetical protein